MIYLDYQSTTPLAPEAWHAMKRWLDPAEPSNFANPHSAHAPGRAAAAAIAVARDQVAALCPENGRIIFTSGATEAINLAVRGSLPPTPEYGRNRIVTFATEHAAVLDTVQSMTAQGYEAVVLPVMSNGLVDLQILQENLNDTIALVAIMQINNEIGVIQPIETLVQMAQDAGALFLCDAVQSCGRILIPQNADMIAISAHKIHGPKGIGALWVRDGVEISPIMHGGGQEMGLRSGTLSPALCAGFGAAAALAASRMDEDWAHVTKLQNIARTKLRNWHINGGGYPGNLNIRRDGLDVARLMSEARNIAFSAGSACASGSGRPSHVLRALGLSDSQAKSSIRLGWGRYTALHELEAAIDIILKLSKDQGIT